jgi:hypothetical protein
MMSNETKVKDSNLINLELKQDKKSFFKLSINLI